MSELSWSPFEDCSTLGRNGSSGGNILRDEEHSDGARITLEKDTDVAPFAITCGVYGNLVHTRFFDSEDEANSQYDQMKNALSSILVQREDSGGEDSPSLNQKLTSFIETYP
jgi:hypothetical protein